jgi:hypothetical protein
MKEHILLMRDIALGTGRPIVVGFPHEREA